MCGRYVSRVEAAMERDGALRRGPVRFESYNVAPGQKVPVIRSMDGAPPCELLRWGLVPFWARGVTPKFSTINARAETIATAPAYRGPWKRAQRCILPALGFYEWQVVGDRKQPWFIYLPDQAEFGFAGLWDASTAATGETLESVTIITVPANPLLSEIHNSKARMPAILRHEDHATWLSGDAADARACLAPYPQARMQAYTVTTLVNSPRNNGPELIAPSARLVRPDGE